MTRQIWRIPQSHRQGAAYKCGHIFANAFHKFCCEGPLGRTKLYVAQSTAKFLDGIGARFSGGAFQGLPNGRLSQTIYEIGK